MDWNTSKELGSMEELVAELEKEAYYKLLRAFRIQSNDISWEKESVLTNLREQLRISNDVHGELLRTLDSDDFLQNAIREKEKPTSQGGDQHAIGNRSPRPIRTRRLSELYLHEDTGVQATELGDIGQYNNIPVAGRIVRNENVGWKRADQDYS
ncbi:protein EMSY-LIKE 4-like [Vigna radiata var. radiata]|uniref:Protein EMSY-LIKE 4-like n=1 Tax=Vigna radiata var. radiata TaxID=3916 RepID=A0A3Q0ESI0_VIGRR|nr:protein EMSY-LIKE 4-like [Vigna radiata var. radiata]